MQKDMFLNGEGDAWFQRNRTALEARDWVQQDPLFRELLALNLPTGSRVLEIGCGDGSRLAKLHEVTGWFCHGVDPSASAVAAAVARDVSAVQGTADSIEWPDAYFDLVIFGFCLYLCDRADLFRIAAEADRVLRSPGWLAVLDFHSTEECSNPYSHCPGMNSYKMDYRKLFDWHPHYTCFSHKVVDHVGLHYTDERNDWVGVSVLRKQGRV